MCYSGQCKYEDYMGGCILGQLETKQKGFPENAGCTIYEKMADAQLSIVEKMRLIMNKDKKKKEKLTHLELELESQLLFKATKNNIKEVVVELVKNKSALGESLNLLVVIKGLKKTLRIRFEGYEDSIAYGIQETQNK